VTTAAPVVFDGSGTTLYRPDNEPLFRVTSGAAIIEGFTINSTMQNVETIVVSGGTLRMTKSTLNTALINATNAVLELEAVKVFGAQQAQTLQNLVRCSSGVASISSSEFRDAWPDSTNCQLSFQRNIVEGRDPLMRVQGGKIAVENNLFVQQYELSDSTSFTGALTGSVVRFNTFVNSSGVISDGAAIDCDGTMDVANNIFAHQSMHPLQGPGFACPTRYSLFDGAAVPEQRMGEGNRVTEFAVIFANTAGKDFHLAETSPAKGVAQPNTLNVDLDGNPRPLPAGTNPDVGCFEAP
jgi:hypothetical protein